MNSVHRTEYSQRVVMALSVWTLAAFLLLLALVYVFLVNRAVVHAAARQSLVREVQMLEQKVSEKEARYAQIIQSLSHTVALEHGFVNQSTNRFVQRLPILQAVTLNTVR